MIEMKHYDLEISQFVDNELSVEEQKELFAHLSECQDCRKTLSEFMELKKDSKLFYSQLDVEIEPVKLPAAVEQKKAKNIYRTLFYFSAAASIFLGILFLLHQTSSYQIEKEYSILQTKYIELSKKHDSLNKELNKSFVKEKKLIRSKIPSTNNKVGKFTAINPIVKLSSNASFSTNFKPSQKRQEIEIVQITKNDFLTPQIVGN